MADMPSNLSHGERGVEKQCRPDAVKRRAAPNITHFAGQREVIQERLLPDMRLDNNRVSPSNFRLNRQTAETIDLMAFGNEHT